MSKFETLSIGITRPSATLYQPKPLSLLIILRCSCMHEEFPTNAYNYYYSLFKFRVALVLKVSEVDWKWRYMKETVRSSAVLRFITYKANETLKKVFKEASPVWYRWVFLCVCVRSFVTSRPNWRQSREGGGTWRPRTGSCSVCCRSWGSRRTMTTVWSSN